MTLSGPVSTQLLLGRYLVSYNLPATCANRALKQRPKSTGTAFYVCWNVLSSKQDKPAFVEQTLEFKMTSAVVYDYDDSFGANFVNTKSVPQLQNYPTLGSEGKAVCVRVCLTEREREREKQPN